MSALLYYERIVGRDNGREWRVADEQDDVVCDFPTEAEARAYVERANGHALRARRNDGWHYGAHRLLPG